MLTYLGVAVLTVGLGFPVLLYLMQERLIFIPQPLPDREHRRWAAHPGVEELALAMRDGTRLHGWLRKAANRAPPAPLLLYFGGNAEEVSWVIGEAALLEDWAVAAVNYRGYGRSDGRPGESVLFSDAEQIFDQLSARADIDGARVVAMGRSLGSGVAVSLATVRPLRGVVLVSPYDSVRAIARSQYPWLPIGWMLRHPFDSLSRAPAIEAPVVMLVAEQDTLIGPERSRRLFDAWKGAKRWELVPGTGHDSIAVHPGYWASIADFLAGLEPRAEALAPPPGRLFDRGQRG